MEIKTITRINTMLKARVRGNKYGTELLLSRNGYHWTGQEITPELAKLTIEVLQLYLDGGLNDPELID